MSRSIIENGEKRSKDWDKKSRTEFGKVINALKIRGYYPAGQLSEYFISGEPIYITNFDNARSIMSKFNRHELLDMILQFYIDNSCES